MAAADRIRVGSLPELQEAGRLVAKAGNHGVCVVWDGGCAYAVDDRCPHLGFPLHRGTVENGLLTCHWHNARFDLVTGGTLDPWADDVRAYPVEVEGDDVFLVVEPPPSQVDHLHERLREGLEQGLTLVIAKAVLGLLDAGQSPADIVRTGVEFGVRYRRRGWGAGLTVLVAMANVLPLLDPADRPLALVHGLSFVARDTSGSAPRFPLAPLGSGGPPEDRLASWYRRFVDTRSSDAAERTLLTALASGADVGDAQSLMMAAATDHVFLDGGHTVDFTNKAFEALTMVGWPAASDVLPTLVLQTCAASRAEESGAWRHPVDLVSLSASTIAALPDLLAEGRAHAGAFDDTACAALGRALLVDDPMAAMAAFTGSVSAGATPEQLGRAVALAAALRITRFHVQNDHGDWDVVHHAFTYANAVHRCLVRAPDDVGLLPAVVHGVLRVHLDRFLNVPAARPPKAVPHELDELEPCWEEQGGIDRAGEIAYGWVRDGGSSHALVAAVGRALLAEDAEFHWFQTVEAAAQQAAAWAEGSEEQALVLAGTARFLAAHTPTRRELPQVVRIATRLRRGEALFEETPETDVE